MLFDPDTIQSAGTALPKALVSAAVSFRHAADLLRHEVRFVEQMNSADRLQEAILGLSCIETLQDTETVLRELLRGSASDVGPLADQLSLHCLELYLASLWARRLTDEKTADAPSALAHRLRNTANRLAMLIDEAQSM